MCIYRMYARRRRLIVSVHVCVCVSELNGSLTQFPVGFFLPLCQDSVEHVEKEIHTHTQTPGHRASTCPNRSRAAANFGEHRLKDPSPHRTMHQRLLNLV